MTITKSRKDEMKTLVIKEYPKPAQVTHVFLSKRTTAMDLVDALIGVGGTILGSIGTLYTTRRQEKRSDFSALTDKWKEFADEMNRDRMELKSQYETLKDQEHKCSENLRMVQEQVSELKEKVLRLENAA